MHNLHISLKQGGVVLCIILLLLLLLQLLQLNILAAGAGALPGFLFPVSFQVIKATIPLVREGAFFAGQPYKLL